MPIKRSRTARSCEPLENEAIRGANEIQPMEQSSTSAIGDRNKAARRSTMTNDAENSPVPPPPPPPPPQLRTPPLQINFKEGGGFPVLPPAFLNSCNYCSKTIEPDGDRYMNGGLEAYCSGACRGNFNKMMQVHCAGNRSAEPEPSMDDLQWKKS